MERVDSDKNGRITLTEFLQAKHEGTEEEIKAARKQAEGVIIK